MNVLKVFNQIKDNKYTYSLMGIDTPSYVHINNHVDNKNSVIVPIGKIKELIEQHQGEL